MIAAIAEKKKRSAIAAIAELFLSQRSYGNQALGRYHLLELSNNPDQSSQEKNFIISQNC